MNRPSYRYNPPRPEPERASLWPFAILICLGALCFLAGWMFGAVAS